MGNSDSKVMGGDVGVLSSLGDPAAVERSEMSRENVSELSSFEGAKGPRDQALIVSSGSQSVRKSKLSNSSKRKKGKLQSRDDVASRTFIKDEHINVNLAMSDLMAYLQVVANNSNQLPVTRRDDPEQDKVVTTLSPEEYSIKSAAFVPADVRVIGATFTRYGRVWDLPTSEEYDACDGAQEPGRSYGGACSNALLKVLYDAANENAFQDEEVAEDELFNDDDDTADGEESAWGKSFKSNFSLDNQFMIQNTLTWSELLRKMKAEMKDISYAQIPKITTSRKIELNKPFNLVPDNFNATKGKKRSLLIGCNYRSLPGAELKASHDDVRSMKDYIVNVHGFPETKGLMTILMDDDEHEHPTFMNVVEAFKNLSEESQPGDAVFVQFSGHGGRVLDEPLDGEGNSYDEVIVPSDYESSGLIRDTLIFKTLLAPMRYGVTVTVLIDCCDTGMVLEMPYSWCTKSDRGEASGKLTMNEDFSFLRFLKVVKTLYETSTFTRLGKTVGSALNPSGRPAIKSREEPAEPTASTDKAKQPDTLVPSQDSFLDILSEACHPRSKVACVNKDDLRVATCGKGLAKREARQSLLEQVMNCTLLSPHEEEDESDVEAETFKSRTDDDFDEDGIVDDSFDSYTDEDEFVRAGRKGRSRRRKR